MSAIQNVLNALRKAKAKGITPLDFPKAFRLGGRIYDLREKGFEIITSSFEDTRMARYVLKGEPQ